MELKKEKSCGCIIIKDEKVLLVYEKNRNFWGFPKGHVEKNEKEVETEVNKEETDITKKPRSRKKEETNDEN